MTRVPNWQSRLEAFLVAHSRREFRYGSWDCCLFVCSAIEAMTNVDPAREFRGRYSSREEAFAAVRHALGGRSTSLRALARQLAMAHGFTAVPNAFHARRGDLAIVRRSAREFSLGLVGLNGRELILAAPAGLATMPLTNAGIEIWRI